MRDVLQGHYVKTTIEGPQSSVKCPIFVSESVKGEVCGWYSKSLGPVGVKTD